MGGSDGGVKIRSSVLPKTGCKKKGQKKSKSKINKRTNVRGAGDSTHAGTDASMDSSMDSSLDSVKESVEDLVSMGWKVQPASAPTWTVSYIKDGKKLHKKSGSWYIDDKKLGRLSDTKLLAKLRTMKAEHVIAKTNNDSVSEICDIKSEGITATVNVATTPIPIGQMIRRLPLKKKQKKKSEVKAWAERLVSIGQ